jgi:hypothetical protein
MKSAGERIVARRAYRTALCRKGGVLRRAPKGPIKATGLCHSCSALGAKQPAERVALACGSHPSRAILRDDKHAIDR